MAAPVELFSTSILSNHRIRQRHERYVSILTVKRVPFVYHDLASDEDAKKRWRSVAKDPSIPGLLVHNEWRGTFEEFEESVEFGELDIFLRIDAKRAEREAAAFAAQYPEAIAAKAEEDNLIAQANANGAATKPPAESASKHAPVVGLAQPRLVSHSNKIAAAPSAPLPMAPKGTGARRELNTEAFLESLGLENLKLSEDELREILEEGAKEEEEEKVKKGLASSDKAEEKAAAQPQAEPEVATGGRKKYPDVLGKGMATTSASKPVPRTYTPSAEAAIKPLRLAKMGKDPLGPRSATSPLSTRANGINDASSPPPLPKGAAQVTARYNTAQLSSKALAAEAAASVSKRALSGTALRSAVASGETLEEALGKARVPSATESVVGREDPDELLRSLGLMDLKLTDEEAEAFLLDGTIPEGATEGGARLGRRGSSADRAREETAAREVAKRARERGYGTPTERPSIDSRRSSTTHSRAASVSSSLADVKEGEDVETEEKAETAKEEKAEAAAKPVPDDDEENQETIDASPSAGSALASFPSPPTSPPLLPTKSARRVSSGSASGAAGASGPSSPPVRPARSSTRLSSGSIPTLAAITGSAKTATPDAGEASDAAQPKRDAVDDNAVPPKPTEAPPKAPQDVGDDEDDSLDAEARKGEALLGVDFDEDGVGEDDGATPQMGTRALPSDSSLAAKAAAGVETPRPAAGKEEEKHAADLALKLGQAQKQGASQGEEAPKSGVGLTPSGSQSSVKGQGESVPAPASKPERLDLSLDGARPSPSDVDVVVSPRSAASPVLEGGAGLVTSPSIELSEAEALQGPSVGAGLTSEPSTSSLAASSLSSSSSLSIPSAGAQGQMPSSPPSSSASASKPSRSGSGSAGRTSSASAHRSPQTPSNRRTGMDYQRREASSSSSYASPGGDSVGRGSSNGGARPPPLTLSPGGASNASSSGGGPTTPGSGKKSRFGSLGKALSGSRDKDGYPSEKEKRSPLPFGSGRKKSSSSLRGGGGSGAGSGSGGGKQRSGEERRTKTLSQILREADAAMMGDELGDGGEGVGDGEAVEMDDEEEEEPDDGMGRLPEEEEEGVY